MHRSPCGLISRPRPLPTLRRYNDGDARVVKLVDTADLKSADAESRRAGSSPALGTRNPVTNRHYRAQIPSFYL
jgi:hypothetical protein